MARCPLLLIVAAACCAALAAPGPAGPAPAPAPATPDAAAAPQAEGGAGRAKRYVAALARNGDLPFAARAQWHKKLHPAVSAHRGWQAAAAPQMGPLAGPAKRLGPDADDADAEDAVDDALDNQLEAAARAEAAAAEALAAAAAALAAAESADAAAAEAAEAEEGAEDQEAWKRGIATLAKNGQLPQPDNRSAEQKRGGVAALARQGIRPYSAPWPQALGHEKRSLAALARGGGLSALRYAGAKKSDALSLNEEKRSSPPSQEALEAMEALEALERPGDSQPLGWWGPVENALPQEGKRHLGALRRQGRRRRELLASDYEDLAPLAQAKRFLGRIPRLGRLRPSSGAGGGATGLRRPHSQRAI